MSTIDARATIMVANCESASAPDKHTKATIQRALKAAERLNVDLILWCEIGDSDLKQLADDYFFDSKQYGRPGKDDPEAGCGISWDMGTGSVHEFDRIVGSPATSVGHIRERSIVQGKWFQENFTEWVNALHAPPSRSPFWRLKYLQRALREPGFAGGDTNFLFRFLMRMKLRRGRTVRSVGVLALFVPKRFWVSKARPVEIGSDHKAFTVVVEPRNLRKLRLKGK